MPFSPSGAKNSGEDRLLASPLCGQATSTAGQARPRLGAHAQWPPTLERCADIRECGCPSEAAW